MASDVSDTASNAIDQGTPKLNIARYIVFAFYLVVSIIMLVIGYEWALNGLTVAYSHHYDVPNSYYFKDSSLAPFGLFFLLYGIILIISSVFLVTGPGTTYENIYYRFNKYAHRPDINAILKPLARMILWVADRFTNRNLSGLTVFVIITNLVAICFALFMIILLYR